MSNIQISIVVPCYKQAEFLNETLQSVLDQTFESWECIIVDDGSPDNTAEIANSWLNLDKRFKYIKQSNQGVSAARNLGVSHSSGIYILPLDADDTIGAKYIEKALHEFEENPTLKVVYCEAKKFGVKMEFWSLPKFSLNLLASTNMIFSSSVFKKADWMSVGGYDIKMDKGFEDWEFWISLLKDGGKVKKLDYVGFFYRIKELSRTKKINQDSRDKLFDYMSIKHADFFVKQIGSFFYLRSKISLNERCYKENLKSEKYVIDLFLYRFFKCTLFGKYKPD